jgi:uncharacterized protein YejL (UPF0352 family)
MQKMTRKQAAEALKQVPIDYVITGDNSRRLTPKQREFARQMVTAPSKVQAYRNAYNSNGSSKGTHSAAAKLCKDSRIATEIEALRLASEAEKHRTPAQLRALVTGQLVQHALDDSVPPATRIRALELLGKLTEVASFTERRETVVHHASADIRARLIEQLRSVNVVDQDDGSDLLAELSNARDPDPHPLPTQLDGPSCAEDGSHTVLHDESEEFEEEFEIDPDDLEPLREEDPPLVDGE